MTRARVCVDEREMFAAMPMARLVWVYLIAQQPAGAENARGLAWIETEAGAGWIRYQAGRELRARPA